MVNEVYSPPQPAEDDIGVAFNNLTQAIRENARPEKAQWSMNAIGDAGRIKAMVREYQWHMGEEKYIPRDQQYKDNPPVEFIAVKGKEVPLPKRKKGFINQSHIPEQKIGKELKKLLREIEKPANIDNEKRAVVLQSVRNVANALDDIGIFFDQGQNFATDATLPHDPSAAVPGELRKADASHVKKLQLFPLFPA